VKCDACRDEVRFNLLHEHQSNVYGCIKLTECSNKCTIQQCIDAGVMSKCYNSSVEAKLRTLPTSTYAPIYAWSSTAQEYHNRYCPNVLVQCDICADAVHTRDMNDHLNSADNIGKHLKKLQSVIGEKDGTIKENDRVNKTLKRQLDATITALKQQLDSCTSSIH
jgi:hypothetical protein